MEDYQVPFLSNSASSELNDNQMQKTDFQTCPICLSNETSILLTECQHRFCEACLKSYMYLKISEAQVNEIVCPTCSAMISNNTIQSLMSDKDYKKYKDFLKIKQLELDIYVKWCPVADCKGYDIASEDNLKLICNECGHKYCYLCSGEWHTGKCKDNTELSFKLWAMGNNLKICPRCKNHVQKYGGCPDMVCPRCNFQWCWRCGKSRLSGGHNDFNCFIGYNKLDLYRSIIFILLFLPILFPFLPFLAFAFFYEPTDYRTSFLNCLNNFWIRFIFYIIIFCLSPVLEVLCFAVGTFVFIFLAHFLYLKNFSKLTLLYIILCAVIYGIVLAAAVILLALCPLVGLFFFVLKFYYAFKRCKNRKAISFEYRRTFT